jgi:hypothetical protein
MVVVSIPCMFAPEAVAPNSLAQTNLCMFCVLRLQKAVLKEQRPASGFKTYALLTVHCSLRQTYFASGAIALGANIHGIAAAMVEVTGTTVWYGMLLIIARLAQGAACRRYFSPWKTFTRTAESLFVTRPSKRPLLMYTQLVRCRRI